ncbi:3-dehydroshikimate dehydratase [Lasiodiplodia hormozganensis]|uniref:3-dehydroshikimate dehydratase n=1 Tax=Lasiodiplodia hormozganensis TaxID=869390 RepID=A0AA39XXZ9_9PEZI|nr:3-dehydroshikimate dehydratase [Lasiodiplodia hormozganensis]
MPFSPRSLQAIPTSYATCSIGCSPEHTLPKRLDAIAAAGFQAIELSMPDILDFAKLYLKKDVGPKDWDDLCATAKAIKVQTDAKNLRILMLQPFSNFEGWPEGTPERNDAFERARGWIEIMDACGCDMLQVGASDTPEDKIGLDRNRFVSDLGELADVLAQKNFRLAYENWCWSTHAPDWKDVWDIVKKVDRPNVGLCLDTFQTAGGEWADPTTESGLLEGASKDELEKRFHESLDELSRSVPKDKIYLLQISDAYKPKQPFSKHVDQSGTRPRGRWSHDFRPLPFDGGYLPVADVAKAILKTGFRSWFSYEVFDGGPDGKGRSYDLQEYAKKAMESHKKLLEACIE